MGEGIVELMPLEVEGIRYGDGGERVAPGGIRLSGEEIGEVGAATVAELLGLMGNVVMRSYGGSGVDGQLALRGFGENSGLRVLVMMDGQPMNPPDMGGINWLGMSLGEMEVVEVTRGGQTVRYGGAAFSGVVKLWTRMPDAGESASAGITVGADGERGVTVGYGNGAESWGWRAGVDYLEGNGYRVNSDYDGLNGTISGRVLTNGMDWRSRLTYTESEVNYPGPLTYADFLEDPRQSKNGGLERTSTESIQWSLRGHGEWGFGEWTWQSGAMDRRREADFAGQYSDNHYRSVSWLPVIRIAEAGRHLMVGMEWIQDRVDYTGWLEQERQTVRAMADLQRRTMGGYIFGGVALTDAIELAAGVRRSQIRTDNDYHEFVENQLLPEIVTNRGTFPNPNYRNPPEIDEAKSYRGRIGKSGWAGEITLSHQLGKMMETWIGYDRTFRYPSLDEAAAYQGYPLADPLNRELEPERGVQFEAGMRIQRGSWQGEAIVFRMDVEGEIIYDAEKRLNVNLDHTRRDGLEVTGSYSAINYGAGIYVSLTDATYRGSRYKGGRIALVPEIQAGGNLWWRPVSALRLEYRLNYLGDQLQGNDFHGIAQRIPAHSISHLALHWQATEQLSWMLTLGNLTNKRYVSTALNGGFYPGSGRSARIRIEWKF